MLDNFDIFYEEIPAGGGQPARYVINASDIPSPEVKSFYVKEAWYFDQNNSIYDVKILAICPIAFMITDIGEQPQPMFWAKYEDVRPYVKNNYIMTSNINNVKTYTVDDFFRSHMYDGEIIMTENLMNLSMQQLFPDPDTMKIEQQRIEEQLVAFNDSLWIKPDTTVVLSKKEAKAAAKKTRSVKSGSGVSSDNKSAKKENTKQPKAKPEKAVKSSPTRSIRR
jgi:gliding motility associated protien GldN